jgi:WD40 repeat protein
LWEAATGQPLGLALAHPETVRALAFSPDGRTLLTGCDDRQARFFSTGTGALLDRPLPHEAPVRAVAFSPDGRTALTAGSREPPDAFAARSNANALPWGVPEGKPLRWLTGHQGLVQALAFSPAGRALVTGSIDQTARLWELPTGRPLGKALKHEIPVRAMAFSADGRRALTGGLGGGARLWDAATGRALGPVLPHTFRIDAVAFSADGQAFLAAGPSEARFWRTADGRRLEGGVKVDGHAGAFAAFSPDGTTVFVAADQTAWLRGGTAGPPRREWHLPERLSKVVFSTDGRTLLLVGQDSSAHLYEGATGRPKGPPLVHRGGRIHDAAFSPDGQTVLTGSRDRTAQAWDVATARPLGPPLAHQAAVLTVAFRTDGQALATGSQDGAVEVWALPRAVAGSAERLRVWVEVLAGMELNAQGAIRPLSPARSVSAAGAWRNWAGRRLGRDLVPRPAGGARRERKARALAILECGGSTPLWFLLLQSQTAPTPRHRVHGPPPSRHRYTPFLSARPGRLRLHGSRLSSCPTVSSRLHRQQRSPRRLLALLRWPPLPHAAPSRFHPFATAWPEFTALAAHASVSVGPSHARAIF